jgi:DNA polymerase-3 subunit delta
MRSNDKSLTFVYGSDDFLVDRRSRAIFDGLRGDGGEIFTLDGSGNLKAASVALSSVQLFGGNDVVWLRSVRFLGEIPTTDGERVAVAALVEEILAAGDKRIIVSAAPVDRRTKIFKELSAAAHVIAIDGDGDTVGAALGEFVAANGVGIDGEAARLLRMKCGTNTRLLANEVSKLATYVGQGGHITAETVSSLVEDQDPGNFFEPVEKFFRGDLPATFRAIDGYFFANGDGRPLLAALQSRTRTLIQLRALADSGHLGGGHGNVSKEKLAGAAKFFSMDGSAHGGFNVFSQNPWYLSKAMADCPKLRLDELLRLQSSFFSAFSKMAANYQDQGSVLKELACATVAMGAQKF